MEPQETDKYYLRDLEEIKQVYSDTKDWGAVFSTAVYDCDNTSAEAFIDYVEEVYKTKVRDVKHLQKLTGITHVLSRSKVEAKTEAEGKRFAVLELEEIITVSKVSKYSRAIKTAINTGAKYSDLLRIKPQEYGLPDKWLDRGRERNQNTIIQFAIVDSFHLYEVGRWHPEPRDVADKLEAPYSVIVEAIEKFTY